MKRKTAHRRGGGHPWYDDADVDFFIIFCPGLPSMEFYILPADLAKRTSSPRLFPHRPMKWSLKDFTWETYRNAFDIIKPTTPI
jgi:hypothetical protein